MVPFSESVYDSHPDQTLLRLFAHSNKTARTGSSLGFNGPYKQNQTHSIELCKKDVLTKNVIN